MARRGRKRKATSARNKDVSVLGPRHERAYPRRERVGDTRLQGRYALAARTARPAPAARGRPRGRGPRSEAAAAAAEHRGASQSIAEQLAVKEAAPGLIRLRGKVLPARQVAGRAGRARVRPARGMTRAEALARPRAEQLAAAGPTASSRTRTAITISTASTANTGGASRPRGARPGLALD